MSVEKILAGLAGVAGAVAFGWLMFLPVLAAAPVRGAEWALALFVLWIGLPAAFLAGWGAVWAGFRMLRRGPAAQTA